MKYRRLTPSDRYQIEAYRRSELSVNAIALKIKRSPSTVSRELKRLSGKYDAEKAVVNSRKKASNRRCGKFKIKGQLKKKIDNAIKIEKWSPEQVANALKGKKRVSYQTIYRYVRRVREETPDLWKSLRLLRKRCNNRQTPKWRPNSQSQQVRISIDKRPKIVEKRKRIGDFERDVVHGKANGPMLLTIVDRTSRLLKLEKINARTNDEVHRATLKALKNEKVLSITNDNGGEFRTYKRTMKALKTTIYFSKAYRSWERGTNENTNGLLRQYFPRNTDLTHISKREIKRIEHQMNNRPRKCLDFRTPKQVHAQLKRSPKLLR